MQRSCLAPVEPVWHFNLLSDSDDPQHAQGLKLECRLRVPQDVEEEEAPSVSHVVQQFVSNRHESDRSCQQEETCRPNDPDDDGAYKHAQRMLHDCQDHGVKHHERDIVVCHAVHEDQHSGHESSSRWGRLRIACTCLNPVTTDDGRDEQCAHYLSDDTTTDAHCQSPSVTCKATFSF